MFEKKCLHLSQSEINIPNNGYIGYYWIRTKQEIKLKTINQSSIIPIEIQFNCPSGFS